MNKEFIAEITSLKKAIENKKLVIFAGAGISVDSGIPGWGGLIEELKKELEIPEEEHDPLRIAQMYFNKRGAKESIEKLKSILRHKKTRYNDIHEIIFDLRPEHILTTNFDDLLEQAMGIKAEPFSVVRNDSDFPHALNTNLLVKVHGDLESTAMVFKEDDYLSYTSAHPLLESFIRSVFASKVVLFVGYSFSDIDLKMILHSVRHILGADFQKAYLLSLDDPFHHSQRDYLEKKGIIALNYHDAKLEDGNNFIEDYLKGKNSRGKYFFKECASLSPKGQQLLNFLGFIQRYEYFDEALRMSHIIDKMYYSLQRFKEIRSLPPQFLETLFPFSEGGKANYELWKLSVDNKDIVDLLADCTETPEGISYTPKDGRYSEKEKEIFTEKLRHIACILNYSYIYYIIPSHKLSAKIQKDFEYKKLSKTMPEQCDCFNCLLKRFDLKFLAQRLERSSIHPASEIEEDLLLAFIHYRTGSFHTSYRLFEEAATKAWSIGKFISYYIAKQNSKYLKVFMQGYGYSSIKDEHQEYVYLKLDDLDLDNLIHRISKPGTPELKLLRIIKYDEIIDRAIKKIDEYREEILQSYERYEKGGGQWGGHNYPALVLLELSKLYSFYSNNFIIADEFTSLKKTIQKAIETLIISFATDKAYS